MNCSGALAGCAARLVHVGAAAERRRLRLESLVLARKPLAWICQVSLLRTEELTLFLLLQLQLPARRKTVGS